MRVYVGTSGWSYDPWKGVFYPASMPSSKMLAYYAERFSTVEVNNTFYRMPTAASVTAWAGEVPGHFRFAVKAPQRITHQLRLKAAEDAAAAFVGATAHLGERRGPLVFQLPPNFKKDAERLAAFISTLAAVDGPVPRVAFEFRNATWFDDEIYGILRAANAALCTAEGEGVTAPFTPTADFGYLRLRAAEYTDAELAAWADRILEQPWSVAFVYMKHEDEAKGPDFAVRLLARLGDSAVRA